MDQERWRRIEEIFHAAMEREPDDRRGYLNQACAGDERLLKEVQTLVDRAASAEHFLEEPTTIPHGAKTDRAASGHDMIGQTVSHYRILEHLGAGGMGVVYKAEDLRLKRLVALKFLPHALTSDGDAKRRLIHEAQAASALDHPHICTIHEVDETADGRLFIAMGYYEGETLSQRLARGPLEPHDAIAIAVQVTLAAAAAHDAGIVHRDIKPANIMLTSRGDVKLVDFGIAKLDEQTRLTRTGMTVGTVAYMAPEVIAGLDADARSDVWSIGVVLFEMLTGRLPFDGNSQLALINAIANQTPHKLRDLRSDLPIGLDAVIAGSLAKNRTERYAAANAFLRALQPLQPAVVADNPIARRTSGVRRLLAAAAIGTLLVVALFGGWRLKRHLDGLDAQNVMIPQIRQLVSEDRYVEAMTMATRAELVLKDDPALTELWDQLSLRRDLRSTPEGARVSIRDTALQFDWQPVGTTPLVGVRVPKGTLRWRFEKEGFETAEFISPAAPQFLPPTIPLARSADLPPRMLTISAGDLAVWLTGYDTSKTIRAADYLIDRFEVTNREFKEFVDAGGYTKQDYWKHPFIKDGRTISWPEAMDLFRDPTGRPGPATWEIGTFPKEQADYPVGGVSWYEAAAYAEFRGKSLPTVYHWAQAAGALFAADITPLSNIRGSGLQPVGRSRAVSTSGLSDMAGNVKEWTFNEQQPRGNRYVLGGAWNEPDYMFIDPDARTPFDRPANVGFRCAKYPTADSAPAATLEPIARVMRNYDEEKPPTREVFNVYKALFSYDPTPLEARTESVDDSSPAWRREKISFNAAYGKERVAAHLFLPKGRKPPYSLVLYWPGSGVIRAASSDRMADTAFWDFLVTSGRAVLVPVYYGTYERKDEIRRDSWPNASRAYRDWTIKQVQDARRALEYAVTRADLRPDAIGYIGVSWGARMAPVVLAQEPKLRAAVLASGGLSPGPAPPEVDGFTFAHGVSVPVLMFNGASDVIFELEKSQKPLFRALGTPAGLKQHVVMPSGHGAFAEKRSQFIREVLDWFDRYLGPAY